MGFRISDFGDWIGMSDYRGHTWGAVGFFGALSAGMIALSGRIGDPLVVAPFRGARVVILFGIALLTALWPDVDIRSKGQRLFYGVFLLVDVALIAMKLYYPSAILGILAMIPLVGKHRGWTHTIWAAVLIPSPLLILPMYFKGTYTLAGLPYFLAAFVGYLSHLVLDRAFL